MRRVALFAMLAACGPPAAEDLEGTRGGGVDVFFNEPGTRRANMWEPDAVEVMIDLIDDADVSILAVMGFGREQVVDALIRAYDRGVDVRMVGDAGHLTNLGYHRFRERHIPMRVGNHAHIMHD
jgi:phosphatidylserine/phosphatidylglycerophosphate/cardiolipin synthase-like enzyme